MWLVANGWIYPTDSSINVAIGQGQHVAAARPGARSAGRVADDGSSSSPDLGISGRQEQDDPDRSEQRRGGRRRARAAAAAADEPRGVLGLAGAWPTASRRRRSSTTRLQPERAELRYRGFSQTDHARRDVPGDAAVRQDCERRASAGAIWSATTRGSATCASCSTGVDDRYVIMNAGDELQMSFRGARRRRQPAGRAISC